MITDTLNDSGWFKYENANLRRYYRQGELLKKKPDSGRFHARKEEDINSLLLKMPFFSISSPEFKIPDVFAGISRFLRDLSLEYENN
jgi:hypothetical protein